MGWIIPYIPRGNPLLQRLHDPDEDVEGEELSDNDDIADIATEDDPDDGSSDEG